MLKTRVIPILLLQNGGLVKGEKFKNHKYVGDPINAVRIFNEKEVDELAFLDISATLEKREPNYELIADIATEAFMPLAYGGGISSLTQIEKLFRLGVEKVIINSTSAKNTNLVKEASLIAGAQSIVVAIDVKKTLLGRYEVFTHNGTQKTALNPIEYALIVQEAGAGEIILTNIELEGTAKGYDLEIIEKVTQAVSIPVIAHGGAANLADFKQAVDIGASAVAAGSMFTFHGKHKAVLITYPSYTELENLFLERE
ncbi:MAG: AglZ/HisF2 family acetamidino modification protein [Flavobacteriales bacterium]|nr:AglZ/HisF2 family acetamidino modification protein [Flavobacteriales bacterium]